jgi:type I restriction enzyme S subunit
MVINHQAAEVERMAVQVEQLITEHLDLWTQAQTAKSTSGRGSNNKIELTGIKKLRELILELAVRGKLVPQDPNDEPASELLKRIAAEKEALVKAGKLKKQKVLPPISDDEKPFDLPHGWEWARLGDLGWLTSSSRVHQKDWTSSGVPFYRTREIVSLCKLGSVENELFISEELYNTLTETGTTPETNDVMLTGVGTIGVPYLVNQNDKFYFKDASVLIFKNVFKLKPEFFIHFFKSPNWIEQIHNGSMGTTVHTLTIARGVEVLVPVPPVTEQQAICVKIEELMTLCDQLEQQSYQQLDAHNQLVDALLATLTQSQNADELASNWHRLAVHFDTLFTTEYSIEALKQTILQLAVMGKLVKQDPNDEPASELLKRIAAEKDALVKAGKIKKQKPLPPISDDEKPFELPQGWACERIGTFALVGTGATPARDNPAYWFPKEVNWVSSGETSQQFIFETKEKVSLLALKETNVSVYPVGTLIVAMYGQGKTRGQITELKIEAGTNQACAAIELIEKSEWHKDFVKLFFQKSYSELRELAAGGAQPNLNVGKIAETVVSIPPLNEQKKIVVKVRQLLEVCDLLVKSLNDNNRKMAVLAESLVEQVVA